MSAYSVIPLSCTPEHGYCTDKTEGSYTKDTDGTILKLPGQNRPLICVKMTKNFGQNYAESKLNTIFSNQFPGQAPCDPAIRVNSDLGVFRVMHGAPEVPLGLELSTQTILI